MGKVKISQAHENQKDNKFPSIARVTPPENYQYYAGSHVLGSPGSTPSPYNPLLFNTVQCQKVEVRNSGQTHVCSLSD